MYPATVDWQWLMGSSLDLPPDLVNTPPAEPAYEPIIGSYTRRKSPPGRRRGRFLRAAPQHKRDVDACAREGLGAHPRAFAPLLTPLPLPGTDGHAARGGPGPQVVSPRGGQSSERFLKER